MWHLQRFENSRRSRYRTALTNMSQSWLESSLHRSSKLGREVLERARKRSVRWTNTGPYDSRASAESTVTGELLQPENHTVSRQGKK